MGQADSPAGFAGQFLHSVKQDPPKSAELLILGGGIMGLWAAAKAGASGVQTVLLDAGRLGQGASGGLLGALMAHMPDKWNDKKQFQFEALLALEGEIAALEAATGRSCGYHRGGRLIPLPKPHLRETALRHSAEAELNWRSRTRQFQWQVLDEPPQQGWPDRAFTGFGLVHDTLAARVSPRKLTAALAFRLGDCASTSVVEANGAVGIDPKNNTVLLADGQSIAFGKCIIAAGHQSFPLIEALSLPMPRPLGAPVKGQAALLRAQIDGELPLIFLNGLYVVPHDDGLVAIGSTSEDSFDHPHATDRLLDDLIARARALVPMLTDAPVVERWAGLRPKAVDRDPMVGPHPDHPDVIALTGGFKVSFGIAHRLAEAALAAASSQPMAVPSSFTLESHLAAASR